MTRSQYFSSMRVLGNLPLLLLGLAPALHAQTSVRAPSGVLRGVVRDSASGEPVGYALVTGERDQQTFTSATGRFTLTGLPVGKVRLRVRQVGFRLSVLTLELDTRPGLAGAPVEVVVLLSRQALVLPELSAEANRCSGMRDVAAGAPEGASLLGQAFQNAERILALERKYPFVLEFHRVVTVFDSSYNQIQGRVDTLRKDSRKYVSYRPGRVLDRGIRRERVAAFTTSDFAGDEFQASHCFWYAGRDSVLGAPGYRIDFAPKPDIRSPDWAGSMLVDSASLALIRTETRLVNLPRGGTDFLNANCTIFYQPILPSLPQEFQLRCVSWYGGSAPHMRVERLVLINHRFIGRTPDEMEPTP